MPGCWRNCGARPGFGSTGKPGRDISLKHLFWGGRLGETSLPARRVLGRTTCASGPPGGASHKTPSGLRRSTSNLERPTANDGPKRGPWRLKVGCWLLDVASQRFRGSKRENFFGGILSPRRAEGRERTPRTSFTHCAHEPAPRERRHPCRRASLATRRRQGCQRSRRVIGRPCTRGVHGMLAGSTREKPLCNPCASGVHPLYTRCGAKEPLGLNVIKPGVYCVGTFWRSNRRHLLLPCPVFDPAMNRTAPDPWCNQSPVWMCLRITTVMWRQQSRLPGTGNFYGQKQNGGARLRVRAGGRVMPWLGPGERQTGPRKRPANPQLSTSWRASLASQYRISLHAWSRSIGSVLVKPTLPGLTVISDARFFHAAGNVSGLAQTNWPQLAEVTIRPAFKQAAHGVPEGRSKWAGRELATNACSWLVRAVIVSVLVLPASIVGIRYDSQRVE